MLESRKPQVFRGSETGPRTPLNADPLDRPGSRLPNFEVHQLELARVELPEFHPEAPGSDTVYGFLVRDDRACVLVDTGVGIGNNLIDRLYKPERIELSDALAKVGVYIRDITTVVNSHLHFDHCGNNFLFPGIPILVQEVELDAARQQHYTVPNWVDFAGANYVPIRGMHVISKNLKVFPTPGHTPGHQSLVVSSGSNTEIIVAQAAYSAREFQLFYDNLTDVCNAEMDRCLESNATWSSESYIKSLADLRRLRPDKAHFSHDSAIWRSNKTMKTVVG